MAFPYCGLYNLRKKLHFHEIEISGPIFRCHTQLTFIILFAFASVHFMYSRTLQPIQCISSQHKRYSHIIDTYCWTVGTYTVSSNFSIGFEVDEIAPGVSVDFDGPRKYYKYYKWVQLTLMLQGITFYAPMYIWKFLEGGLMNNILWGLKNSEVDAFSSYAFKRLNTKLHQTYVMNYWICEFSCLLHVLIQIYATNLFLNGEFLNCSWHIYEWLISPFDNYMNPFIYTFPRITKCDFFKYGPSGMIQNIDALCILTMNQQNEMIYIVLCCWFLVLLALLAGLCIYRLFLFIPCLRPKMLKRNLQNCQECEQTLEKQIRNLDLGDWWILYMVKSYVHPCAFDSIIRHIASDMIFKEKERRCCKRD